MTSGLLVDTELLREQVREKYREVAVEPHRAFHFHTGRPLAARLGYDVVAVDSLPDRAVESFAGVGNPFSLRHLQLGDRVVDVGSRAGFDSFIAAGQVGPSGSGVGVIEDAGFVDVMIGEPVDTFAGAGGQEKAAEFDVHGYDHNDHRNGSQHRN